MIGTALAGLSLIGTGVNVFAALESSRTNSAIGEFNARQLDAQARDVLDQGVLAVGDAQARGRQIVGAQRAAFAGQGVSLDSGSAVAVQADTDRKLAQTITSIQADAVRQAAGLKIQAISARMQAKWAKRAGILDAVGTGLSGAGQAGQMIYQDYRSG